MNLMGQKSRFGVLILLLLALTLHSTIPTGFMPEQGRHGLMRLAICTGSGHATVLVDASKYEIPSAHKDNTHKKPAQNDFCPFAPVLASDSSPSVPFVLPVFAFADIAHADMAYVQFAENSPKPWFAQGPPVS